MNKPINEYVSTLIMEERLCILIENNHDNGTKEIVELSKNILNGKLNKKDVIKELERISNQYGDDCFNSYDFDPNKKKYNNLKDLEIISASGASSKKFYLHMADVADKVYSKERNIKIAKKIILSIILGASASLSQFFI